MQTVIRQDLGLFVGPDISDEQRASNGETLNAIIRYAGVTGQRFEPPPGWIEYTGTLRGANGADVFGHGNLGERADGTFRGTQFVCFNDDALALDLQGSGESVDKRLQCRFRGIVLRHGRPHRNRAKGIAAAWNMRAEPFLDEITIKGFGDHGHYWSGPNWQVATRNLRVENCGNVVPGSSGIGKDEAVDCGTWNDIRMLETTVEGCGTDESEAGGIDIPTRTANRGLLFGTHLLLQSNFGKREMLVTNMAGTIIDYFYAEHLCNPRHPVLAEFERCSGRVRGGFVTVSTEVRHGARIRRGSPEVTGIYSGDLHEGMEVEGPMIGNTPPPRVLRLLPDGVMLDQPALGDWDEAEIRLRLMDTTGILLRDSPDMHVDDALAFGERSWARNVATVSQETAR